MRIRTGLRPEDWLDHGPSTPLPPKGYSGGLVVGDPDWKARKRGVGAREREYAAKRARRASACELIGRCRHGSCIASRVEEAKRLFTTTNMTLEQIGQLMGGRDHSTVAYWIREYQDKDVAA